MNTVSDLSRGNSWATETFVERPLPWSEKIYKPAHLRNVPLTRILWM